MKGKTLALGLALATSVVGERWYNHAFNSETTLLAKMIYGEARGCSIEEKKLVAETAVNRRDISINSKKPQTLKEVILAPSQYHCMHGLFGSNSWKVRLASKDDPNFAQCYQVAEEALAGKYQNHGLVSYHTIGSSPSWGRSPKLQRVSTPGMKHTFYASK